MFTDATEDDGSQVGHQGHHVTTQRLRGHVSAGNATHSLFLVPGFTSATVIVSQWLSFSVRPTASAVVIMNVT